MLNSIESKISGRVIPSKKIQEAKKKIADMVMELVRDQIEPLPEVVDAEIGGSYAKGTWLPEKADIDIFVRFEEDVPEARFRELGERVGFMALGRFKPYTKYSEHPYVEALVGDTKVNVVPCYKVKAGQWRSAADRSQFHTKYMREHLDKQKQVEVRILKKFLKANNLYGAEISSQGFSGYVTEVLVLNLGSFNKILKKFAGIAESDVIGKASKKFDTMISIIDPVDGNRNLAAAISNENISRFILLSRAYLKKPSVKFFRPATPKSAQQALGNVITVDFVHAQKSPDIIWGQVKRASSSLAIQLNMRGFRVVRNTAFVGENGRAALVFLMESLHISEKDVRQGPEVFNAAGVSKFVAKNRKKSQLVWVNGNGRVMSLEDREFNSAKDMLEYMLTKRPSRSGLSQYLKVYFKGGFRVSVGGRGLQKAIKDKVLEFVTTDEKIFPSR